MRQVQLDRGNPTVDNTPRYPLCFITFRLRAFHRAYASRFVLIHLYLVHAIISRPEHPLSFPAFNSNPLQISVIGKKKKKVPLQISSMEIFRFFGLRTLEGLLVVKNG